MSLLVAMENKAASNKTPKSINPTIRKPQPEFCINRFMKGESIGQLNVSEKDLSLPASKTHDVFKELYNLFQPFIIRHYYTDVWFSYDKYLSKGKHTVTKKETQGIERKHLDFWSRIKGKPYVFTDHA